MPLTNPWTAFVDPVLNWSSLAVLSLDQPSMLCRQRRPATVRHNEYRLSISPNWSSKKAWKAAQLEEYLWVSCYLVSTRAHGSIWSIVASSQAAQIRGQRKHSPKLIGCCSIRPYHIPKTQDLGTLGIQPKELCNVCCLEIQSKHGRFSMTMISLWHATEILSTAQATHDNLWGCGQVWLDLVRATAKYSKTVEYQNNGYITCSVRMAASQWQKAIWMSVG